MNTPPPIPSPRPGSFGALTLSALALVGCLTAHRESVPKGDGGGNALGVGSTLCVSVVPQSIDFGVAVVGSVVTRTLSITNRCGARVGLTIGELTGPNAHLFPIAPLPGTVLALADGDSQLLTLQYQPVTASPTPSQASFSIDLCDSGTDCHAQVTLQGTAVAFGLAVVPDALNFRMVQPQEVSTKFFTLSSTANTTIHLIKDPFVVNFTGGMRSSSGPFQLGVGSPTSGTGIAPGQSIQIPVIFSPAHLDLFEGELDLVTDDPQAPHPVLGLTGFGGGARISCGPPSLDFGTNAVGIEPVLSVFCINVGTDVPGHPEANLLLPDPDADPPAKALALRSGDPAFMLRFHNPFPGRGLAAGETAQIDVTYTPTLAGTDSDTLIISSNDPTKPSTSTDLNGSSLVLAPCDYHLIPSSDLAFGHVAVGAVAILPLEIVNQGADSCLLKAPRLLPGSDPAFSLPGYPPGTSSEQLLAVGSHLDIDVQFAPTSAAANLSGALLFEISDPKAPSQSISLTGSSLVGCLVGDLEPIDLGLVGYDAPAHTYCGTAWRTLTLWNICEDKDINVTSIGILDRVMPNQFLLQGDPSPVTLPRMCSVSSGCYGYVSSGSASFQISFDPTRLGTDQGGIQIFTDDLADPYLIPLKGNATQSATQTDSFTGRAAKIDLLWVMDVTVGGDASAQQLVIGDLADFLTYPIQNGIDFQMAATSTNVYRYTGSEDGKMEPCPGCQVDGQAMQVVTQKGGLQAATTSLGALLTQGIEIYCGNRCNGFLLEGQLLEAAYEALSPALLSGYNQPFYRDDASLAVVMVEGESTGDESDVQTVSTYYSALASLKGVHHPDRFSLSHISRYGGIGNAKRLSRLVQMTGGVEADLSHTGTPAWTDELNALWPKIGPRLLNFPLSGVPVSGTLAVTNNGVDVPMMGPGGTANWSYDAAANAIRFDPSVFPAPGDDVEISYTIACGN